jgi:hypothetical protein
MQREIADLRRRLGRLETLDSASITAGTWTPTLTLATPGEFNIAYSVQTGIWRRIDNWIEYLIRLDISSFSLETGSGDVRISLAHTVATYNNPPGVCRTGGVVHTANTVSLAFSPTVNQTYGIIVRSIANSAINIVQGANLATGNSIFAQGVFLTS